MRDSTIVYPAKDSNDITAGITFSRFSSQKTGWYRGLTSVFPIKEDENVYAVVELDNWNWLTHVNRDLMFHLDWIRPDGQSIYRKEFILPAGDFIVAMESSISSSPGNRQPGRYSMRVYLFRELIAEKHFEFRNEFDIEKVKADIVFFKNIDKETGEMKGINTVFEIKKKAILRAKIDLSNTDIYKDAELPFRLEWTGPDGKEFYSKKIDVLQTDTVSVINSSISITPDKRGPGEYFLRVYLFDDVVGEGRFVLVPAE